MRRKLKEDVERVRERWAFEGFPRSLKIFQVTMVNAVFNNI